MEQSEGGGRMLAVASHGDAADLLAAYVGGQLTVAAYNSPQSSVLSGDPAAIAEATRVCAQRGVRTNLLRGEYAFHTPHMARFGDELLTLLSPLRMAQPQIPLYSTLTGSLLESLDQRYWADQMKSPVQFHRAMTEMLDKGLELFIEIGPHPALLSNIDEISASLKKQVVLTSTLRRDVDSRRTLAEMFAAIYVARAEFKPAEQEPRAERMRLPKYPWQRRLFARAPLTAMAAPLEGVRRITVAGAHPIIVWEGTTKTMLGESTDRAAQLAAVLGGAREVLEGGAEVEQIAFESRIPADGDVQLSALASSESSVRFSLSWREEGKSWELVAHGVSRRPMRKDVARTFEGEQPQLARFLRQVVTRSAGIVGMEGWPQELVIESVGRVLLESSVPEVDAIQVHVRPDQSDGSLSAKAAAQDGRFAIEDLRATRSFDGWRLGVAWQPAVATPADGPIVTGRFVIIDDGAGVGESLAQSLRRRGASALVVRSLEEDVELDGATILHLGALNLMAREPITASVFDSAVAATIVPIVHTTRRWAEGGQHGRWWFVTRRAQCVREKDTGDGFLQSLLWGFGRALALEHPDRWGGAIDLEDATPTELELVADVVLGNKVVEAFFALRDGAPLVSRLVRQSVPQSSPAVKLERDGTYIITGGLSGMGRCLARWAAYRGAGHLVLLGRRPQSSATEVAHVDALVAALARDGARCTIEDADLSSEEGVRRLLSSVTSHERVRGVFHVAGIDLPQPLEQIDPATMRKVLDAKAKAAALLSGALEDQSLEFFLSFSSVGGVWGASNHAVHAAANHFVDALGARQRAVGMVGQTISWGVWDEVGLPSAEEVPPLVGSTKLHAIKPEAAMHAMDEIFGHRRHDVIGSIDWQLLKPLVPAHRQRSLFEHIGARADDAIDADSPELLERLRRMPEGERRSWMRARLQEIVASILGIESSEELDDDRTFFELGMDSLAALQLKTRLETWVQTNVPPMIAYDHPTVDALLDALLALCAAEDLVG